MAAGGVIPGLTNGRERELLERLGLDERATSEDVARTRDELQAFLAAAPKSIRGWARRQASDADEAYLLLSDPTAWRGTGALPGPRSRSVSQPDGPATPPVRRAIPAAPPTAASTAASEGDEDAVFDAMLAEVTPSMHRDRRASPVTASRSTSSVAIAAAPAGGTSRRFPRLLAGIVGLAVVAVGVFAIYQFGATPPVTGTQSSPAPTAGLDEARVAELMGRIQQDPKDAAALLELGDAFFQAGEYSVAQGWLEKLVALEPNNVRARLALGAAGFNLGDSDAAKEQWLGVLKVDSENVEAHYDLGFLYLNETPPDYAGVQSEWGEVVRLAPGTDIADVVQQHLDAIAADVDASAAPPAAPTAAPSAAASTEPTTAPSAAPTTAPSGSVAP